MDYEIYVYLRLVGTIVSSLATGLTLMVIVDMNIWNGHIFLITAISIFQLIYDVSSYTIIFSPFNSYNYIWSNILQYLGGLSSSIVSNEMACIVLFVIIQRRSFVILDHTKLLLFIAVLPSTIAIICYSAYVYNSNPNENSNLYRISFHIYFWGRVFSILFNFIFCLTAYILVRRTYSTNIGTGKLSRCEVAISTLVNRLLFYPIVQLIGRSGDAWYEAVYGSDLSPSQINTTQFTSMCFSAMTTPVVAVGYMVIFFMMQPRAFKFLRSRVVTGKRFQYVPRIQDASDDRIGRIQSNSKEIEHVLAPSFCTVNTFNTSDSNNDRSEFSLGSVLSVMRIGSDDNSVINPLNEPQRVASGTGSISNNYRRYHNQRMEFDRLKEVEVDELERIINSSSGTDGNASINSGKSSKPAGFITTLVNALLSTASSTADIVTSSASRQSIGLKSNSSNQDISGATLSPDTSHENGMKNAYRAESSMTNHVASKPYDGAHYSEVGEIRFSAISSL